MFKLPEEGRKWGESKGAGNRRGIGGEREEKSIFSPLFQCHKIKDGGYIQQYEHEHEQGFAHPKYACTAGYMVTCTLTCGKLTCI